MIIRARAVVTMDGTPIENGAVVVAGNKITEVGEWHDVRQHHDVGEVIDLGECALLPGLINAHCHLDYTCLRGKIARQDSFTDWIRAINAAKAQLSADDYVRSINDGFVEARRFGTTSIANLTGFPGLIPRVPEPIRTWWFAELINVRDPQNAARTVEEALRLLPSTCEGIGLAPHAPYTASPDLFRRCEEAGQRGDVFLTTHLAESAEEMEMSLHGKGPLAEFLRPIANSLFEGEEITPVEHLAKICRLDERWLLVHLNEIREGDIDLLGRAHIVHCPRSHEYFGHTRFEFSKLKARGLNICLGTDSLASNEDLSLFAEMRQLQKTEPSLSARELLELVTVNPVHALRREGALGRLRVGYLADLIAVPFRDRAENIWDEIVAFEGAVPWMMNDGVLVANA